MNALVNQIRIILVKTSHPGNIGSVARAMKTMGLTELYLVAPKQFPAAEATALATHAQDILSNTRVVNTLIEALQDVSYVYATSANLRELNLPTFAARQAAKNITEQIATHKIAIVFGPENYGLTNEELHYAHALLQIPTAEEYRSLNLAAAVQIVAYELRLAFASQDNSNNDTKVNHFASTDQMERFYHQLEKVLIELQFLDPAQPRQLMPRLRQLFNRAHLDNSELNILRGILRAIEEK